MKDYFEDIICARATPSGTSSIAIIRVSGKDSWNLLKKIFIPFKKKNILFSSHCAYYGNIVENIDNIQDIKNIENKEIIDNVLVIPFKKGKSFTGEESFEINCHGSEVIISIIIKLLLKNGARLADPGEFTKRAFLNDKLDLLEAESIMDIVNSSTKKSAMIAIRQLTGKLSNQINFIKEKLLEILASIEVNIDYPEEDLETDIDNWKKEISGLISEINKLLNSFNRGKFYRDGIMAVILGKTNSGKSTLFNLLLNEDKAIVSDIHGTTRDYLDGLINIDGYGIRIYDTAGLRDTNDPIEIEGIKRAYELSNNADVIIYIIDASEEFTKQDLKNISRLDKTKKILFVINKIDIKNKSIEDIIDSIKQSINDLNYKVVSLSAFKKKGIEEFNCVFLKLLINEEDKDACDPIMTNERHAGLLNASLISLNNSLQRMDEELLDLVAFELREALNKLGEITGEITTNDLLTKIFSNFCVGK